jgi:hypothetical protein
VNDGVGRKPPPATHPTKQLSNLKSPRVRRMRYRRFEDLPAWNAAIDLAAA